VHHLPSILQLAGLLLLAVVAFLLHPILGGAVIGGELFFVGEVLERRMDARQPSQD
jgi:hypothetical protein